MSSEIDTYHQLAKDAGNRLRSYILSVSSGACGVFFFTLTTTPSHRVHPIESWSLIISLLAFLVTVGLCLWELRIDAKRFFALAKELEKPEDDRNWDTNEKYKKLRYRLIHISYFTLGLGIFFTGVYLLVQIIST